MDRIDDKIGIIFGESYWLTDFNGESILVELRQVNLDTGEIGVRVVEINQPSEG